MVTTHAPARARPGMHEVLRSPGRPVDTAAPAKAEVRFGSDFSRVPASAPVAQQTGGGPNTSGCVPPCNGNGAFPWVPITPRRLFAICKDKVRIGTPSIVPVGGCTPGHPGRVVFHSGGWAIENECDFCDPKLDQPPVDRRIQIGFIQTVERTLQGGVYFKKVGNDWVNVDNIWFTAKNERDCLKTAKKDPWYGPDKDGNFGPQPFMGPCPSMFDNPHVALPTHKGGGVLRRVRIDGVFNVWLVAKPPTGPLVFIHHWVIDALAVAVLPDDADPCNFSQWNVLLGGRNTAVTARGPGQGPATPVLTGTCANATRNQPAPE